MKMNTLATCNNISTPHKYNGKQKKPETKEHSLYNSSYIVQVQGKLVNSIEIRTMVMFGARGHRE